MWGGRTGQHAHLPAHTLPWEVPLEASPSFLLTQPERAVSLDLRAHSRMRAQPRIGPRSPATILPALLTHSLERRRREPWDLGGGGIRKGTGVRLRRSKHPRGTLLVPWWSQNAVAPHCPPPRSCVHPVTPPHPTPTLACEL